MFTSWVTPPSPDASQASSSSFQIPSVALNTHSRTQSLLSRDTSYSTPGINCTQYAFYSRINIIDESFSDGENSKVMRPISSSVGPLYLLLLTAFLALQTINNIRSRTNATLYYNI